MLLRSIGRFEAQLGGDFGSGWRGTGACDGTLDKIENLLLAIGELGSAEHDDSCERQRTNMGWAGFSARVLLNTVFLSSNCIFNQFLKVCKWYLNKI
jgi:hypothetical protein